jgi:hypothetical protein
MAIAYDNSTNGGSTFAASLTYSHTTSGSDRFLVVATYDEVGATSFIAGVTYAGVSMTKEATIRCPSDRITCLWKLHAPASGANNVVITSTGGSIVIGSDAASYTGAAQTGQPDSSATNTATAANSLTVSTTVVASNCWLVGFFKKNSGGAFDSAGAGTTARVNTAGLMMADSNGTVGTGSQSLIANYVSGNFSGIIMSIAEASAGGANQPRNFLSM